MREKTVLTIGLLLAFSAWATAQNVPPPPRPIIETDLRDNNIKMRSIELERVKREANKLKPRESTRERELKFAEVKKDFESIQKLQDSIIKAYTTGKEIDHSKISKSSLDITRRAMRLDENLFGAQSAEASEKRNTEAVKRKGMRELIIELDNAIGVFIKSPIFKNTKVVDSKISAEAQLVLKKITRLSYLLSLEAERIQ